VPLRAAVASGAAALVVLSAPLAQRLIEALAASGGDVSRTATAATVIPIACVAAVSLYRIRERRLLRYGALAAALVVGLAYEFSSALTAGERFHFVEYGGVALLFYWACRPFGDASLLVLPIVAALFAGTLDEWFQWFVPLRAGEARDVALNAVSGTCGVLVGLAFAPPALPLRPFAGSAIRRVTISIAAAVVAFVVFFQTVHVGHDVATSGIGVFRSRYSSAELDALAQDRLERWRAAPPTALRRFSREDQYLAEGIWHTQRRNRAFGEGDLFTAWRENLILERYFGPVLDTPSYLAPAGNRWASEQRADAEARSGDMGQPYVSTAHPFPLYVWP